MGLLLDIQIKWKIRKDRRESIEEKNPGSLENVQNKAEPNQIKRTYPWV